MKSPVWLSEVIALVPDSCQDLHQARVRLCCLLREHLSVPSPFRCTGVHTSLLPSLNPLKFCILPGKEKFDCLPPSFGLVLCLPTRPLTIQLPPHESWVNPRGLPSPDSCTVNGARCSLILYKSSHHCLSLLTLHTTIVPSDTPVSHCLLSLWWGT